MGKVLEYSGRGRPPTKKKSQLYQKCIQVIKIDLMAILPVSPIEWSLVILNRPVI